MNRCLIQNNKTVLVIAHRLKTIENSDQIILMNQWQTEEIGTHRTLMEQRGHYHRMVKEQEKAQTWVAAIPR